MIMSPKARGKLTAVEHDKGSLAAASRGHYCSRSFCRKCSLLLCLLKPQKQKWTKVGVTSRWQQWASAVTEGLGEKKLFSHSLMPDMEVGARALLQRISLLM